MCVTINIYMIKDNSKNFYIEQVQWYISHTCNLTCSRCLSYNNYNFNGHFSVSSNLEYAKEWSKSVYFNDFAILGGEPLSNPEIDNWVVTLKEIFKDSKTFRITTNGTLLNRHIKSARKWIEMGVLLEICVHDELHMVQVNSSVEEILKGKDVKWTKESTSSSKDLALVGYINGKQVCNITMQNYFYNAEYPKLTDNIFHFNQGDAELNHKTCPLKECHYIIEGKLYKCSLVGVGKYFSEQFYIDPQSKNLLLDYKPIDPFSDTFFADLGNITKTIPQCSLCSLITKEDLENPENYIKLDPLNIKKDKIIKISRV